MTIRIITDTPSDISIKEGTDLNINIVSLKIHFDELSYTEGVDLSVEDFYQKLKLSKSLPTTSTPSPEDFLLYYEEAKKVGDDVIVITLASALSGTYQCANLAKNMANYSRIFIIDSEQATISQMLLVRYAIKLRNEGKTAEEIVDFLENIKNRVVILAMVDTLEYLHKGGRLSKNLAIAGNILKLKPIITLDKGSVSLIGKARGFNGSVKTILKLLDDYNIDLSEPIIYGYTGDPTQCKLFKERADGKYKLKGTRLYPIGSVIGTHAGPGAFAIAFISKNEKRS